MQIGTLYLCAGENATNALLHVCATGVLLFCGIGEMDTVDINRVPICNTSCCISTTSCTETDLHQTGIVSGMVFVCNTCSCYYLFDFIIIYLIYLFSWMVMMKRRTRKMN